MEFVYKQKHVEDGIPAFRVNRLSCCGRYTSLSIYEGVSACSATKKSDHTCITLVCSDCCEDKASMTSIKLYSKHPIKIHKRSTPWGVNFAV